MEGIHFQLNKFDWQRCSISLSKNIKYFIFLKEFPLKNKDKNLFTLKNLDSTCFLFVGYL
jgi:hypothetical protein